MRKRFFKILEVFNIVLWAYALFLTFQVFPYWTIAFILLMGLWQLYANKRFKDLNEDLFGLRQGWFESDKSYLDRIWAISGLERPEDKTMHPWGTKASKLTAREEQKH